MDGKQKKDLEVLLRLRRQELSDDLENNDYSHIESVKYSKLYQIECIGVLLDQLD